MFDLHYCLKVVIVPKQLLSRVFGLEMLEMKCEMGLMTTVIMLWLQTVF